MHDADERYPEPNTLAVTAEKIRCGMSQAFSQEGLHSLADNLAVTATEHDSFMRDAVVIRARTAFWGLFDKTISVHERWPADWWQAFRERWFPAWWLRRYPVQYRKIDIDERIYKAVCPHLHIAEQGRHITWLVGLDA